MATFEQRFGASAYADWRAKHGNRAGPLEDGIVKMLSGLSDEQYNGLLDGQGNSAFLDAATRLVQHVAPRSSRTPILSSPRLRSWR